MTKLTDVTALTVWKASAPVRMTYGENFSHAIAFVLYVMTRLP